MDYFTKPTDIIWDTVKEFAWEVILTSYDTIELQLLRSYIRIFLFLFSNVNKQFINRN